jgi:hypothetical protein
MASRTSSWSSAIKIFINVPNGSTGPSLTWIVFGDFVKLGLKARKSGVAIFVQGIAWLVIIPGAVCRWGPW